MAGYSLYMQKFRQPQIYCSNHADLAAVPGGSPDNKSLCSLN